MSNKKKQEAYNRFIERNPDYNRDYYQRNKEKLLEKRRQRYLANKQRVLPVANEYYQEHREHYIMQARKRRAQRRSLCSRDCLNCKLKDCILL